MHALKPPFVPHLDSDIDTSYFDNEVPFIDTILEDEKKSETLNLSPCFKNIPGFTFKPYAPAEVNTVNSSVSHVEKFLF